MRYKLTEETPDALVIHCSDPRFQRAFKQFVYSELNIQTPMFIVLPGVSSHFGVQGALPKNWYGLKESIATMTGVHKVPRVILINHDDCKGYAKIASLIGRIVPMKELQSKHARALAEFIRKEYLPNAEIEAYQAKLIGQEIEFERVA